MILFLIGIAILYTIIVFLVHKFVVKDAVGDISPETIEKKFWLFPYYWQAAAIIGFGILAGLLAIAKWTNILPNFD